jgi:hypothetical protein
MSGRGRWRIQRTFGVNAFPTYVLIDREGIGRLRIGGTSFERAAALSSEIEKQLKSLPSS